MKVLLVNPWGINNDEYYTSGLIYALSKRIDVDLAGNWHYKGNKPVGQFFPLFFKKSEFSKRKTRIIMRGIEYVAAYVRLLKIIKKNKYDYINIQWLLAYKIDKLFLKIIKKTKAKIVLTAHNAVPHVKGQEYIADLNMIYGLVDIIIVHGEAIKKELLNNFPLYENKIIVQPHGAILQRKVLHESECINKSIKEKMDFKESYIMFGNQFYNKGTDRLLKIWKSDYLKDDSKLLIIAGRRTDVFPELDEQLAGLKPDDNVLYMEGYIKDELLDYLIIRSEAVLLPYRHASMSGVVFTAAEYSKTILTTNCGAICEYLENNEDSIVTENSDEGYRIGFHDLVSLSKQKRQEYGDCLYRNINKKYSWDKIAEMLVERVYVK